MIQLIQMGLLWIVQQMLAILPDSPFLNGLEISTSGMAMGIGWLNWLVDVNGCITVFEVWLLALASFYAWKIGYKVFVGVGGLRNVGGLA